MRPRTAAAMTVRAVGSTDGPVPGVGSDGVQRAERWRGRAGRTGLTKWNAVRKAPTIVVVAPCGYHLAEATEQARTVLAEIATTPAGRHNQVWAIGADAYVVRPGPRLVDGLELLAWIIAGAVGDPPHSHAITRIS
jgi:iron complex transport system substrate-binding protein